MEQLRIREKNHTNAEIKRVTNLINKNNTTISRLESIDTDIEFNKKQIEKLKTNNKDNEEKLKSLNKRFQDLCSDLLDD